MIRVKKIEKGRERIMQFSEMDWERIRNLKMSGVRWEIVPDKPVKVEGKSIVEIPIDNYFTFESAVENGDIEKRGAYYFLGKTNLGRGKEAAKKKYESLSD